MYVCVCICVCVGVYHQLKKTIMGPVCGVVVKAAGSYMAKCTVEVLTWWL